MRTLAASAASVPFPAGTTRGRWTLYKQKSYLLRENPLQIEELLGENPLQTEDLLRENPLQTKDLLRENLLQTEDS